MINTQKNSCDGKAKEQNKTYENYLEIVKVINEFKFKDSKEYGVTLNLITDIERLRNQIYNECLVSDHNGMGMRKYRNYLIKSWSVFKPLSILEYDLYHDKYHLKQDKRYRWKTNWDHYLKLFLKWMTSEAVNFEYRTIQKDNLQIIAMIEKEDFRGVEQKICSVLPNCQIVKQLEEKALDWVDVANEFDDDERYLITKCKKEDASKYYDILNWLFRKYRISRPRQIYVKSEYQEFCKSVAEKIKQMKFNNFKEINDFVMNLVIKEQLRILKKTKNKI